MRDNNRYEHLVTDRRAAGPAMARATSDVLLIAIPFAYSAKPPLCDARYASWPPMQITHLSYGPYNANLPARYLKRFAQVQPPRRAADLIDRTTGSQGSNHDAPNATALAIPWRSPCPAPRTSSRALATGLGAGVQDPRGLASHMIRVAFLQRVRNGWRLRGPSTAGSPGSGRPPARSRGIATPAGRWYRFALEWPSGLTMRAIPASR